MPDKPFEPASSQFEIGDKTAYRAAVSALNNQSRPPLILRFIMQALEFYRQSRKMGWSRPWNKYAIMTFESFRLSFPGDQGLITMARAVMAAQCPDLPGEAADFLADLLSDDLDKRQQLMGFIFIHEFSEGSRRFEGVTLSFGRRVDKRFRDRFDLILEAPVEQGESCDEVGNFSRLRVFIDPFGGIKTPDAKVPLWEGIIEPENCTSSQRLFDHLCVLSHDWQGDPQRHWDHWTSAYIDYFGPRRWPLGRSNFYMENPLGENPLGENPLNHSGSSSSHPSSPSAAP